MFRKIVVPLDGSELAASALPYAIGLAAAANGELLLVRVALAPAPMTVDGSDWERPQREAVDEAESYLAGVASTVAGSVPVKTCVPYGRVARELLDTIRLSCADGVVMASHGRTGIAHLLHGSVAEMLLAESPVPVMLVHTRPAEAPAAAFDAAYVRAAVPLDGSTFSETALDVAADLVGSNGELVLVCVVEPPKEVERNDSGYVIAYLDQQEEASTRDAREYLAEVARQLEREHPGITISLDVRIGDAPEGIVMAAADASVDLIVMATHGRTGVRRAFVGSVAGAVARDGSTPVLLVGPHQQHAWDQVPAGLSARA